MSNKIKVWLFVALAIILLGGIVFVVAMSSVGWDFAKLSTASYETKAYTVTEEFNEISVDVKTADVRFARSADGVCKAVCYDKTSTDYTVSVADGKLTVAAEEKGKWYEYIFNFGLPTVTVYLPEEEYSSLTVTTATGDVELPNGFRFDSVKLSTETGDIDCSVVAERITLKVATGDIEVTNTAAETLSLELSTGEAELENVACKNLTVKGGTGEAELDGVIVVEKLSVELSTGDVLLSGCDAGELFLKTGTGDVRGTLLTEKVFIASSGTGRVDVPQTTSGGRCEIKTGTGSIKITIG